MVVLVDEGKVGGMRRAIRQERVVMIRGGVEARVGRIDPVVRGLCWWMVYFFQLRRRDRRCQVKWRIYFGVVFVGEGDMGGRRGAIW